MKCRCGYESRGDYEENMLQTWDCARAIRVTNGFSQTVQTCTRDGKPPVADMSLDDGSEFKEQFIKKYDKSTDKPK